MVSTLEMDAADSLINWSFEYSIKLIENAYLGLIRCHDCLPLPLGNSCYTTIAGLLDQGAVEFHINWCLVYLLNMHLKLV